MQFGVKRDVSLVTFHVSRFTHHGRLRIAALILWRLTATPMIGRMPFEEIDLLNFG